MSETNVLKFKKAKKKNDQVNTFISEIVKSMNPMVTIGNGRLEEGLFGENVIVS